MNCSYPAVILLISFVLSCSNATDTIRNDLTIEDIKGNVRTLSIQTYQAVEKFGQTQEGALTGVKTSNYNPGGFIMDRDELVRYQFYRYVFNANKLPVEKTSFNLDSSLLSKELFAYDGNKNKITATLYGADGALQVKTAFKYDEDCNAIEENTYDGTGALISKFVYKYNGDGKPVEYNGYKSDGKLMNRFLYKYDEKGNRIQEAQILLNAADSSFSATTIHYQYPEWDNTGNWIKQIVLNENKTATHIVAREILYY